MRGPTSKAGEERGGGEGNGRKYGPSQSPKHTYAPESRPTSECQRSQLVARISQRKKIIRSMRYKTSVEVFTILMTN